VKILRALALFGLNVVIGFATLVVGFSILGAIIVALGLLFGFDSLLQLQRLRDPLLIAALVVGCWAIGRTSTQRRP
jgi:hypothetical protein